MWPPPLKDLLPILYLGVVDVAENMAPCCRGAVNLFDLKASLKFPQTPWQPAFDSPPSIHLSSPSASFHPHLSPNMESTRGSRAKSKRTTNNLTTRTFYFFRMHLSLFEAEKLFSVSHHWKSLSVTWMIPVVSTAQLMCMAQCWRTPDCLTIVFSKDF